jgi:hypothetical protein
LEKEITAWLPHLSIIARSHLEMGLLFQSETPWEPENKEQLQLKESGDTLLVSGRDIPQEGVMEGGGGQT